MDISPQKLLVPDSWKSIKLPNLLRKDTKNIIKKKVMNPKKLQIMLNNHNLTLKPKLSIKLKLNQPPKPKLNQISKLKLLLRFNHMLILMVLLILLNMMESILNPLKKLLTLVITHKKTLLELLLEVLEFSLSPDLLKILMEIPLKFSTTL